jgi:hypothetical protein
MFFSLKKNSFLLRTSSPLSGIDNAEALSQTGGGMVTIG